MAENVGGNNSVTIVGKLSSEIKFSHEIYGEKFYSFNMAVSRLSDNADNISVTFSERLVPKENLQQGLILEVEGQFRSYNNYNNSEGSRLMLTTFARDIKFVSPTKKINNPNQIYLDGYVCKPPVYRVTPFGREIADMLIAVNRAYNKSDYIPCIAWGRNARYAEKLQVGDNVKVWGRIQSREYQKKTESGEAIVRTAYEVSVSKMETIHNSNLESEKTDEEP